MRKAIVGCVLVCGLLAFSGRAADPDPEPPSEGLTALKGGWAVTKIAMGDNEKKSRAGLNFVFDGDKLTRTVVSRKGKASTKRTYKVKVDTRTKPHKITLVPDAGGRELKWIFKFEKGELFLAYTRTGDLPADFKDSNVMLMVLKRAPKEKAEK
jgi:uncharacterized protein (TIGR03067 family)